MPRLFFVLLQSICLMMLTITAYAQTTLTLVPEIREDFTRRFNPFVGHSLPTTHEFIFEPLIIFNSMKDNEPEYRLATGYKLDDDLQGITFFLRKNVTWSDGKLFTSSDIAFTFKLIKKHPELDYLLISEHIKSVTPIDPHRVYIKLHKANSQIARVLVTLSIVPEHIWGEISDPINFTNANPVGSGPFTTIESFSNNELIQCQNPYYWDREQLEIDCLRLPKVINNNDFLSRVGKGEFDWSSFFIPNIERHYAAVAPNFHYWLTPASTVSLVFNFETENKQWQKLFNKVKFRRAISMAMQRALLINIAAYGQGEPVTHASGMSNKFNAWADPMTTQQYEYFINYQPNASDDYLRQLGLLDRTGNALRNFPNGNPANLTLIVPRGWNDFTASAYLTAEMLFHRGIQIDVQELPYREYYKRMATKDYQLAITNFPHGATPFRYFEATFNTDHQTELSPRYGMHYYKNNEVDKLLKKYLLTRELNEQKALIKKLNALIAEQQVTVPLFNTMNFYQYNTERFTGWFNEHNPQANPVAWSQNPERLLQVLALKPVASQNKTTSF